MCKHVWLYLSRVESSAEKTIATKKTDIEGPSVLGLLQLGITGLGEATDGRGRDISVRLPGRSLAYRVVLPHTNRKWLCIVFTPSSLMSPGSGIGGTDVPLRTALAVPCSRHSDKL